MLWVGLAVNALYQKCLNKTISDGSSLGPEERKRNGKVKNVFESIKKDKSTLNRANSA